VTVRRATALVALSACCFGSISILTVVGTRAGTSLDTLLFWRYGPAAVVLGFMAARHPRGAPLRQPRSTSRLLGATIVGGAGQALVAGLTLSALRYVSAATVAFLFYTYPAWIALIAAARGTERVDARRAASLALSFGGIVLMVGAPSGESLALPGVLLALGGALSYALYVPFLHRLEARTSPVVASACVTAGAAVAFLIVAAIDDTFTVRLAPAAWAAAAGLSLGCTVLAFLAFLRGLATLGPVRTAIVSTVEPFWTALAGAALLAQPLTPGILAGGALIAAAVVLLHIGPSTRPV
jgi:drug/metabolite transporter (DMT)-like permease